MIAIDPTAVRDAITQDATETDCPNEDHTSDMIVTSCCDTCGTFIGDVAGGL